MNLVLIGLLIVTTVGHVKNKHIVTNPFFILICDCNFLQNFVHGYTSSDELMMQFANLEDDNLYNDERLDSSIDSNPKFVLVRRLQRIANRVDTSSNNAAPTASSNNFGLSNLIGGISNALGVGQSSSSTGSGSSSTGIISGSSGDFDIGNIETMGVEQLEQEIANLEAQYEAATGQPAPVMDYTDTDY